MMRHRVSLNAFVGYPQVQVVHGISQLVLIPPANAGAKVLIPFFRDKLASVHLCIPFRPFDRVMVAPSELSADWIA
jgi:hypothetical protein